MKKLFIPDSWGELDETAQLTFGYGKEKVLTLLHDIANRIRWSGEHVYNLAYAVGWVEGRLYGISAVDTAKSYPGTVRTTNNLIEHVSNDHISDLKKMGKKFGLASSDHIEKYTPSQTRQDFIDLSTPLDSILRGEPYPSHALTALFLLFRESCDPNIVYQSFIDGLAQAYTLFMSQENSFKNDVTTFIYSHINHTQAQDVFINNYIFGSENTTLLINAKLFMNPLLSASSLRLINEDDESQIAVVNIKNREHRMLRQLTGKEEDILHAGGLLLDSVFIRKDEKLSKTLCGQASRSIVAIVAEHLSGLVEDVFERPFQEDVQKLLEFSPISTKYKNFVAPDGYDGLIDKVIKLLNPAINLSDGFFTDIHKIINQLKSLAAPATGKQPPRSKY